MTTCTWCNAETIDITQTGVVRCTCDDVRTSTRPNAINRARIVAHVRRVAREMNGWHVINGRAQYAAVFVRADSSRVKGRAITHIKSSQDFVIDALCAILDREGIEYTRYTASGYAFRGYHALSIPHIVTRAR